MSETLTCQSEYGKLKTVFLKHPAAAFRSQELIDQQWKPHNYLSRPNFEKAIEEYKIFENLLLTNGATLSYFNPNDQVSMDSIYCRDATIATDHGMIICKMGKLARRHEPAASANDYELNNIAILGRLSGNATIEGGDVAWIDQNTLAIGHGYRSNDEGFQQLTELLQPFGIKTMQVELVHYKGKNDVFHLMSIFSPVAKDLAVVYSPLMSVRFRSDLLDRGYQLVEIPDEEFDNMGCNVLAIAPMVCIMVKGNPRTKKMLLDAGCTVHEYQGNNISIKGGGGPTCLTRPIWREIP